MKVSLNPSLNIKNYKSSSSKDENKIFSPTNPPTYNQKVEIRTKKVLSMLRWVVAAIVFLYFFAKKSFGDRIEKMPKKQNVMEPLNFDSDILSELKKQAEKKAADALKQLNT